MTRSPRSLELTRLLVAGAACAALLLSAGCGLFNPEEPEPPTQPGVHLPDLTGVVDSALFSLIQGIETKNRDLYMHAVAESSVVTDYEFHAFFDPQDIVDFSQTSTPPTDWTSRDERTFFSAFVSVVPVPLVVELATDANRADILNPDETVLFRHYRIVFNSPPQAMAIGLGDLYFRRVGVNNEWKLIRWVDRRDTTDFSLRTYGRQRLGPPSP